MKRITEQIPPHLERGALLLGTTAALYAIWLGVGLSGVPLGIPGLGSHDGESALVTQLNAHESFGHQLRRSNGSTPARAHRRAPVSTPSRRPVAPAAVHDARTPPSTVPPSTGGGRSKTDAGPTSSPASDPKQARDPGAPSGLLSTPVDSSTPPSETTTTVETTLKEVVDVVKSTVNDVQSGAAAAVANVPPDPPVPAVPTVPKVPAVSNVVGTLPTVPSLLP